MRSIMEIASIPEDKWTEEERERLEEYDARLDRLLKQIEDTMATMDRIEKKLGVKDVRKN